MKNTITYFLPRSQWTDENAGYGEMSLEDFKKTVQIGSIFNANVYFDWCAANGFGQLSFGMDRETQEIGVGNECMGKETCRQILYALVDKVIDEGKFDEC